MEKKRIGRTFDRLGQREHELGDLNCPPSCDDDILHLVLDHLGITD